MRTPLRTLLLALPLLCTRALPAADLIVGPSGAFATLEAAMAAAQPGDRILLRIDQSAFSGSLPILPAGVTVESDPTGPRRVISLEDVSGYGAVSWRITAAVTLRNLEIHIPVPIDGLAGLPLTVAAPAARITFDDVDIFERTKTFSGSSGNRTSGETGLLVSIVADRVDMSNTRILALDGAIEVDALQDLRGTDALVVSAARLRFSNCELRGGDAPILRNGAFVNVLDGGTALSATSPRVEFGCTSLRDGNGGFRNAGPTGGPYTARSGISAAGVSTLGTLAFASRSTWRAGLPGSDPGVPGGLGPESPLETMPAAAADKFGRSCRRSIRFFSVLSDYIVRGVPDSFEPNMGADLSVTSDDAIVGPFALGFPFRFPGGTVTSSIELDTNCRILPAGSGAISEFRPTVVDFLSAGPAIAPLWTDFDPSSGGAIRFATRPDAAVITWDQVPQFGGAKPITVQAVLRIDNSVTVNYVGTALFDGRIGAGGTTDVLVGVSPGGPIADPGPSDFLTGSTFGLQRVIYEYWGGATTPLDLQLTLGASNQPVLGCVGDSFDLTIDGVPQDTTLAVIRFGVPFPSIDLTGIPGLGMDGCVLHVGESFFSPTFPFVVGTTSTFGLTALTSPSFNGSTISAQVAVLAPSVNALGVGLSNGLRIDFGR